MLVLSYLTAPDIEVSGVYPLCCVCFVLSALAARGVFSGIFLICNFLFLYSEMYLQKKVRGFFTFDVMVIKKARFGTFQWEIMSLLSECVVTGYTASSGDFEPINLELETVSHSFVRIQGAHDGRKASSPVDFPA